MKTLDDLDFTDHEESIESISNELERQEDDEIGLDCGCCISTRFAMEELDKMRRQRRRYTTASTS